MLYYTYIQKKYWVRHLTFLSTCDGNTSLMSDLTDNSLYPSAERIWLCICFAKCACDRLTEDADFGKKKHIFR